MPLLLLNCIFSCAVATSFVTDTARRVQRVVMKAILHTTRLYILGKQVYKTMTIGEEACPANHGQSTSEFNGTQSDRDVTSKKCHNVDYARSTKDTYTMQPVVWYREHGHCSLYPWRRTKRIPHCTSRYTLAMKRPGGLNSITRSPTIGMQHESMALVGLTALPTGPGEDDGHQSECMQDR